MNCCDYNCTQGRDCPARVAKIGPRSPGPEPLPPPTWPEYLRDLARAMLATIAAMLCAYGITVLVLA